MPRDQRHQAEFLAIDRGASNWSHRRARLADRHGAAGVDRVLAIEAIDGRVAMARQEVLWHRWTLGQPGLTPAWRERTITRLTAVGDRLQRALATRLAFDRPPPDPGLPPGHRLDQETSPCPMLPET